MKILIDMNLSPSWCAVLEEHGHEARHWQAVGGASAPDVQILGWAREHGYVVFTNDFDFGAILAATQMQSPSVIQLRGRDVTPQGARHFLVAALFCYASELETGALLIVDQEHCRVRLLPIHPRI
jgi:predicted nuclease of predicted toxin-antitoxin system